MRETSHIFSTKNNWRISDINVWNFHETLPNEVVSVFFVNVSLTFMHSVTK